jgi:hypothetical protein
MKQKHLFFFKKLLYYVYGEKFYKRFNYAWSKKPSRIQIIKEIIKKENYKNLRFSDYFNNHEKFMNLINCNDLEKIFKIN